MLSLEERIDALSREVTAELGLVEAQLAKSAAARTASASSAATSSNTNSGSTQLKQEVPHSLVVAAPLPASSPVLVTGAGGRQPSAASASPSRTSLGDASSPPAAVVVSPLMSTHKEGTLLHMVQSTGLFGSAGGGSFVPHYIVVSGSSGISWYQSKSDYLHQPQRPLGHADFWIETYNSRGSRFKKAAVCWPLILPEDCAAATDPAKTYFAVDYYTANGKREQLVLAAATSVERDEWVQLLTKYIDLYLAPRAESEELQHITRGAAVPVHRSGVIEGEAPGGNIL